MKVATHLDRQCINTLRFLSVDMVQKAWHTESKRDMPPKRRNTTSTAVMRRYTFHSVFAVSEILGFSLSTTGLGISAL